MPDRPVSLDANVSIHATLAGGDVLRDVVEAIKQGFLSTPPSRVATQRQLRGVVRICVSIHATLAGGDLIFLCNPFDYWQFLSTPPSRVATHRPLDPQLAHQVSIHATLAGGDLAIFANILLTTVSIHATLAGGDITTISPLTKTHGFYPRHPRGWRPTGLDSRLLRERVSIHATLAGGDSLAMCCSSCPRQFLSTPPSRVATVMIVYQSFQQLFLSTPTATLTGARGWFLSTPPSRVATVLVRFFLRRCRVSIHATLAGGDEKQRSFHLRRNRFYPRHPRGWRPSGAIVSTSQKLFLSTPPSRVATFYFYAANSAFPRFYPRHPRGWRPSARSAAASAPVFLSTPPSRVATADRSLSQARPMSFYPRHPRGWRPVRYCDKCAAEKFLSTPPSRVATAVEMVAVYMRKFLSTPPSRVATASEQPFLLFLNGFYPRHPRGWRPAPEYDACRGEISFYPRHPRGWRRAIFSDFWYSTSFYPRHPRGWRQRHIQRLLVFNQFLSTPPSRVATDKMPPSLYQLIPFLSTPPSRVATPLPGLSVPCPDVVSIHATLAGGDAHRGLRTQGAFTVSIHATLAGGDPILPGMWRKDVVSIHATLAGGDSYQDLYNKYRGVSIHATLAGGDLSNRLIWFVS